MDVNLSENFRKFLDRRVEGLRTKLYPVEQILKSHENESVVGSELPEQLYYFSRVSEKDSVQARLRSTDQKFILHPPDMRVTFYLLPNWKNPESAPDPGKFLHKYNLSYNDGSTTPIFTHELLGVHFFMARVGNQTVFYSCSMRNLVVVLNDLKKAESKK
jgi:hypothetical protein